MPTIMASDVNENRRNRVKAAVKAACRASSPAFIRWRAKLITSTLLAVPPPCT